ncbi:MAG TPA: phosphoenolpyruvate carboxykinase domain-containing protein, partial [Clostridia bacterium]|nr:phosphoenolpyruvate carboxykinase domain-containing protein [Clostridia bacterium]
SISKEFDSPNGVPLSAMVFGGRRAKTAPLVYQSLDWVNGVFVGSIMASETTAAASGAVGVVRRDPMAMLPFCGYNMGDYFQHWLNIGKDVGDKVPKIFHVNWFRLDDEGHFLWPGFGENLRVLLWILDRCEDKVGAVETPIGYLPKPEDINLEGIDVTEETLKELLSVDKELWLEDTVRIEDFYNKIGNTVPKELRNELTKLKKKLS